MSHRWCYSRLNNQDFDLKKKYCRPILEKAMATHSSTLAWKIPWIEEPGRLQSIGSLRVGHDWATSLSFSLSCIGEGNGNPLQCSCLENPRDRGAWWAAIYGVTQSRTRLKWLSSSLAASNPGTVLQRGFLIPDSISFLVTCLFESSVSLHSGSAGCVSWRRVLLF